MLQHQPPSETVDQTTFDLTGNWLKTNGVPHFTRQGRTWTEVTNCSLGFALVAVVQCLALWAVWAVLKPSDDPVGTLLSGTPNITGDLVPLALIAVVAPPTCILVVAQVRKSWGNPNAVGAPESHRWRLACGAAVGLGYFLALPVLAAMLGYQWSTVLAFVFVGGFWLIVTVTFIAFRVNRMVRWAREELRVNFAGMFLTLLQGLPVLILFIAFFLLTAEIWQVLFDVTAWKLCLFIGTLLGLNLLILWVAALGEVRTAQKRLENPQKVCEIVPWSSVLNPSGEEAGPKQAQIEYTYRRWQRASADMPLGFTERINAVLVVVVFQLLVLVPTMLVMMTVLWWFSFLLISDEVAGKFAQETVTNPLSLATFVAVFLGVFCMLSMTVTILRDDAHRNLFASRADMALSERLAVRRIHLFAGSQPESGSTPSTPEPH